MNKQEINYILGQVRKNWLSDTHLQKNNESDENDNGNDKNDAEIYDVYDEYYEIVYTEKGKGNSFKICNVYTSQ